LNMNRKIVTTLFRIVVFSCLLFGLPVLKASSTIEPQYGTAWEVMAPLPEPRQMLAVVADGNGHIFALGGYSDNRITPTNTNYRYNIATDTWDTMMPIPDPLARIDAALIDDKIYIPGNSDYTNTYIFSITTNTWTVVPSQGHHNALDDYKVVVHGKDLMMLGGRNEYGKSVPEVWILETTTGVWSSGVPMQLRRHGFAAGVVDGKIYVAGGSKDDEGLFTVEIFDGELWLWGTRIPSDCSPSCRGWSAAADAVGPQGLWLAGGFRGEGFYLETYFDHAAFYDPSTRIWTTSPTVPQLNIGRFWCGGDIADDGYFYVIGGLKFE